MVVGVVIDNVRVDVNGDRVVSRGSMPLLVKFVVVGVVSAIILAALGWVSWIISDREDYRQAAVKSISESYASGQRFVAPVLVQPYTDIKPEIRDGKVLPPRELSGRYLVFPVEMRMRGTLVPTERYHGLYKVSVYEMQVHVESTIDVPASPMGEVSRYGQAYLALGVSDVRGLVGTPRISVNGTEIAVTQDDRQKPLGLKVPLAGLEGGKAAKLLVRLDLTLAGTQEVAIAPVANSNQVSMESTWPSPLFGGKFLPRSRFVSRAGFKAVWDVSSLSAATQQQMSENLSGPVDTLNVSLLETVDPYKLSMRAVKYGVLFVLLTFAGLFGFEVVEREPMHPVQYLLVGLGLAIFFLLLVSFSEHTPFAIAYLVASGSTIALLGFYLSYVLRRVSRGVIFASILAVLYAAIYGLLILEENALLLGSLLLFGMLAVAMYVTRSVDWYRSGVGLAAENPRTGRAKVRGDVDNLGSPPPPYARPQDR